MAKRRRISTARRADDDRESSSAEGRSTAEGRSIAGQIDPIRFAVGLLGAALVYVFYYPSDSIAVESGDALWLAGLAIAIVAVVAVSGAIAVDRQPATDEAVASDRSRAAATWASRLLDILPWLLAAWMMLAALLSSPPGNLRMATNEAWLWVTAAAVFTASRRLMYSPAARRAALTLIVVGGSGLATHGLHQYFISLPANRLAYEQDPDRVLNLAGVVAPEGSAERMVFENRLYDGGPTATFALANSLAAVLLVGVILSLGVLRFHWQGLGRWQRVVWILAALLCASCLLAARSRSAALAMLVGSACVFVAASRLRRDNPKALLMGLAGVSVAGIGIALFVARVGNREWLAQAPASLAFRFQYWRSTWQMALDHPLWTAGPGNFQSMYARYREPSATEQIAEPHNLFFETLASGGFIGLGLLLLTIAAGLALALGRREAPQAGERAKRDADGSWIWLGAASSVSLVWLIGWASRNLPDLQASLFALPVSILLAVLLGPTIAKLASRDLDSIFGVALGALMIHLLVSGGWTIPGVAIVVWHGAAVLTRTDRDGGAGSGVRPISMATTLGCLLMLLLALYFVSIRPVTTRKFSMAIAEVAQTSGELGKSRISLERAFEADRWSADAALWLADYYRWRIIAAGDRDDDRRRWASYLQLAKQRAGDDPAVYRMVGAQQLHVYQRHGDSIDLEAAAETFQSAVDWSPADQWLIAQLAVVAAARGKTAKAGRLGDRAWQLSRLGGNIERALSKQLVYEARPLGSQADRGPVRRPADQLLAEPADH